MTDQSRLLAGRYRVEELVGRGGMADVYRGRDERLGRVVAVKLLKSTLSNDPAFRTRFRQEAQAASRMSNPTIVRVFDAGEEPGLDSNGNQIRVPYIVMEYVEGAVLADLLKRGPLKTSEAVRITGEILTALEYSHRAGVIHRDIKPGNVMIATDGQVKVMDFGIARAVSDSATTAAQTTAILGTASYLSPEQARGETVDARTDLYSTGVVLYELLTGKPPFRGETPVAVAYQHVSEPPRPPSDLNPEISPALDQVTLHALAKARADRFQSAAQFKQQLELAASGQVPTQKLVDQQAELWDEPEQLLLEPAHGFAQLTRTSQVAPSTETRPPAMWIVAGVASLVLVLVAIGFWVLSLTPKDTQTALVVPSVSNMDYAQASAALEELGLVPDRRSDYDAEVAEDQIIRTEPAEGVTVTPGQDVQIWISLGAEQATVPDVTNKSLKAAQKQLEAAGFTVGVVSSDYSANYAKNAVIETSPKIGDEVDAGTTINITVANGLVRIDDYVGRTGVEAQADLDNIGVTSNLLPDNTCPATGGIPVVNSQSEPAGELKRGKTVNLLYCTGN